jgi:tetratricopeptide (TPR) repeat protein
MMVKWLNQMFGGNEEKSGESPPVAPSTQPDKQSDIARLKDVADAHMRKGENAGAEALYREILAKDPDFANAHCNLGFVLNELGRRAEAMASLRRAAELNPKLADAHYLLSILGRQDGDLLYAESCLRNAIEAAADFEPAYIDLAHIFDESGRKSELHLLLSEGIRQIPETTELNFLFGRFLFLEEKFNDAIERFLRCVDIDPNHVQAWVGLGNCAKFQFRIDDAVQYLQRAYALNPQLPELAERLQEAMQRKKTFVETALLIKATPGGGKRKVRLVCATKARQDRFFKDTALGQSIQLYARIQDAMELQLYPENSEGLSTIYNKAIAYAKHDPAHLVFIHDDVYLLDFFWIGRVAEALAEFDVVGLAGNKRRVAGQPGWRYLDDQFTVDGSENLSGTIAMGKSFTDSMVSHFGAEKQACKLLDGVFLAADSSRLTESGLGFDEQFRFHFYDLDFCRQAELKNMRMGTWPISVLHLSHGNFNSPAWRDGLQLYRTKYGE